MCVRKGDIFTAMGRSSLKVPCGSMLGVKRGKVISFFLSLYSISDDVAFLG